MKRALDFVPASSLPRVPAEVAEKATKQTLDAEKKADAKAMLREYYKNRFPFDAVARWLSTTQAFSHREIAYSFDSGGMERYNGYVTSAMWADDVCRRVPSKIDVGAVYPCSIQPHRARLTTSFQPWRRELTFDVDANDYDNARWCCRGQRRVCSACWPLIVAAVRVIDDQLREEFGYVDICWFYSGRRGVHCWVRDGAARKLTPHMRRIAVEHFTLDEQRYKRTAPALVPPVSIPTPVATTSATTADRQRPAETPAETETLGVMAPLTRVNLGKHAKLQPFLVRAIALVEREFLQLLEQQRVFVMSERWDELLALLPCAETRRKLNTEWLQVAEPPPNAHQRRWEQVCDLVRERLQTPSFTDSPHVLGEIVLSYMYPRIDTGVLLSVNHMLKAPFVVHPATGRIVVPLQLAHLDAFRPETALTVDAVMSGGAGAELFASLVGVFERSIIPAAAAAAL